MHSFRTAIEARDIDAAAALLADNVEFRSPVVFSPYQGRDVVAEILHAVLSVFEDFHYVREFSATDSPGEALVFRARVGDKQIEGCDFLHRNDAGKIDELVVMVRPLSGAHALADAVRAQLGAVNEAP